MVLRSLLISVYLLMRPKINFFPNSDAPFVLLTEKFPNGIPFSSTASLIAWLNAECYEKRD